MDCQHALSLVDVLNAMEDGIYITGQDYTYQRGLYRGVHEHGYGEDVRPRRGKKML